MTDGELRNSAFNPAANGQWVSQNPGCMIGNDQLGWNHIAVK